MSGQTIGAPPIIGLQGDNEAPTFESGEDLIESARREMHSGELLHVLDEGIAVFVAARETGKYENGGGGVSPGPGRCFKSRTVWLG